MAGRLYRMAKVVSANPKNWGVVDANEISGFRQVKAVADLYNIAECILSSVYGDGTTDGADAVGQIWHVSGTNEDYRLTNWANRKSASGWTKVTYGSDVSVPVKTAVQSTGAGEVSILSDTKITVDAYTKTETKKLVTDLSNSIALDLNAVRLDTELNATDISTLNTKFNSLDQTLFEVVAELPKTTATIKKHIYLVKGTGSTGNTYDEWIYTGDLSAAYDSTKWEKFGTVEADVNVGNAIKEVKVVSASAGFSITTTTINGTERIYKINYPVFGGSEYGLVPSSTNSSLGMFLRGDGTWATPTNTDTHWTTHMYVGTPSTDKNTAAANGDVYLKLYDNTTAREQHLIKGTGATTVTSDVNGNITINSTNTTYNNATTSTAGLMSADDKKKVDIIGTDGMDSGVITVFGNDGKLGYSGISFSGGHTSANNNYFDILGASDDNYSGQLLILCDYSKCSDGDYTDDVIDAYVEKYGTGAVIIDSPYVLNDISISGSTLTITKGDQTTKTITLPSYSIATSANAGLIKPFKSFTSTATCPSDTIAASTTVAVNKVTDISDRYYAVTTDAVGHAFVNVPWSDRTSSFHVDVIDGPNNAPNNVLLDIGFGGNGSDVVICSKLTESEILAILK